MRIRKQFKFEAAHRLPHHTGKCASLHGHSYRLDVTLCGRLQATGPATGMVVDFDELTAIVTECVLKRLDHTFLNDLIANPTAEEIALWIYAELSMRLTQLEEIVVWETRTAAAVVRSDDARTR